MTFEPGQIVHSIHYPEERMRVRRVLSGLGLICEMIDEPKVYSLHGEWVYPTGILTFENVLQ